jgi:hypothetical protein
MGLAEKKNRVEHDQLVHMCLVCSQATALLIGWLTYWLDCCGCTVRL